MRSHSIHKNEKLLNWSGYTHSEIIKSVEKRMVGPDMEKEKIKISKLLNGLDDPISLSINQLDHKLPNFFLTESLSPLYQFSFPVLLVRNQVRSREIQASLLLHAMRSVKSMLFNGKYPVEYSAGYVLDSSPYRKLFKWRRSFDKEGKEFVCEKDVEFDSDVLRVAVISNGNLFILQVSSDQSPDDIYSTLIKISSHRDSRDNWITLSHLSRENLSKIVLGDENFRFIWNAVQDADIVLNLIDESYSEDVERLEDFQLGLVRNFHCSGFWGDKSNLFVTQDGSAGFLYDHCYFDGAPGIGFASVIAEKAKKLRCEKGDSKNKIDFKHCQYHVQDIDRQSSLNEALSSREMLKQTRTFKSISSDKLNRKVASASGLSADALIQIVIQRALYESMPKHLQRVVEVVSIRHFRDGRIAGFRVDTPEMEKVRCIDRSVMLSENNNKLTFSLLVDACNEHKDRIKNAKKGPVISADHLIKLFEIEYKDPTTDAPAGDNPGTLVSAGVESENISMFGTVAFFPLNIGYTIGITDVRIEATLNADKVEVEGVDRLCLSHFFSALGEEIECIATLLERIE